MRKQLPIFFMITFLLTLFIVEKPYSNENSSELSASVSLGALNRFYSLSEHRSLLSIPRRKIQVVGDSIYLFNAANGSNTMYWVYSSDKGVSWDTVGYGNSEGDIGGEYYDHHFHSWENDGMHFATGQSGNSGLWYRYINSPAQSGSDKEATIMLDSRQLNWSVSVAASSADEIWLTTRYDQDSLAFYHTTDRFQTIAHKGFIGNNNLPRLSTRIGSCIDDNGNAIFVALLSGLGSNSGYYYWQWSDTENRFVGNADSAIVTGSYGMSERGFSFNYANNRLHLTYPESPWGSGTTLVHHFYQDGVGGWIHDTASVIGREFGMLSYPILCNKGDSMYLFYNTTPEIAMKTFDLTTYQWLPDSILINDSNDSCRSIQVPQTVYGDFIPVAWVNARTGRMSSRVVHFTTNINDADNDGVADEVDNCPNDYNPTQTDNNNNGVGDVCDSLATDIGDDLNLRLPDQFRLSQNYPNPFNISTVIEFSLPKHDIVTFTVYNVLGKIVYQSNENYEAGRHQIFWDGQSSDGEDLASGIYYYRIQTQLYNESKKMLLLK